jgi:hypothetical protein
VTIISCWPLPSGLFQTSQSREYVDPTVDKLTEFYRNNLPAAETTV